MLRIFPINHAWIRNQSFFFLAFFFFCLVVSTGLVVLSLSGGLFHPGKFVVNIALFFLLVLSPFYRPCCTAAGVVFAILAIFNMGRWIGGGDDCGCFAFSVNPVLTGIVDLALCVAWLAVGEFYRIIRKSICAIIAGICTISFACGYLGLIGPLGPASESRTQPMQLSSPVFPITDDVHPRYILLFDSGCPLCLKKTIVLRSELPQNAVYIEPSLEIDLGERCVLYANTISPVNTEPWQYVFSHNQNLDLPILAVVFRGKTEVLHSGKSIVLHQR